MPKNPSPEPASILDTVNILDTMIMDSDSDSEAEPPLSIRLYSTKPRNSVQRRATITGASPTTKHGIDIEQFWKELKQEHTTSQLRDKAASCAHGLDTVPSNLLSQTCLSIEQNKRKKRADANDKKVQFQEKSGKSDVPPKDNVVESKGECKTSQNSETLTISNTNNPSQVSQTSANVTNNNNSGDTSVPLDECNNFIRDRHSNRRNIQYGKESISSVKERGKLDKSYSTPAYDLMDTESIEERKQKLFHTLEPTSNVSNLSAVKTDNNSASCENQKDSGDRRQARSNLDGTQRPDARNAANEKHTTQNEEQSESSELRNFPDALRNLTRNVTDAGHGNTENQSNKECIIPDVNISENVIDNLSGELENVSVASGNQNFANSSMSHEINEKLELATSTRSNGESNQGLTKFEKILQTFNGTPKEHAKLVERKSSVSKDICTKDTCTKERTQVEEKTNCDLNSEANVNLAETYDNAKTEDSVGQESTGQSCKYVELTKIESGRKPESKSHLIPPDPPPRKYYSKFTMNSSDTSKTFEEEKYRSQRPNVRRDLKRPEFYAENHGRSNSEFQEKQDYFDACNSFAERSIEFIDEVNGSNERRPSLNTDSSYVEYNDKQMRENKSACDKYEPFTEKFPCASSTMESHNHELYSHNMDSPDGSCSSKQSQFVDHRSKVSEKEKNFEKGVVNKAMMVARSIGLHGSLSKSSSNSPRSNRKRSILFASKRSTYMYTRLRVFLHL